MFHSTDLAARSHLQLAV